MVRSDYSERDPGAAERNPGARLHRRPGLRARKASRRAAPRRPFQRL